MTHGADSQRAHLVHLSGRQRGRTRRLVGTRHLVREADGSLATIAVGELADDMSYIATIAPDDEGWRLEADGDTPLWVNGLRSSHRPLHDGDLIEIRNVGVLRFRPRGGSAFKSVREALGDCFDCARLGGTSLVDRAVVLTVGAPYELATQVAPPVRVALGLLIVALVGSVTGLWLRADRLERELASRLQRLEGAAELLESSEGGVFTAGDFESARSELDFRIDDTLSRIEALEYRAGARGRVIQISAGAVVFLQGAYGFVDPRSGRPLRMRSDGVLTLGGTTDDVVELRYTGTGFLVADHGVLVTNRHVALPWEFDDQARRLVGRGFTPVMRRLVGFLPGRDTPFSTEVLRAHAQADVALLTGDPQGLVADGLELAEAEAVIGAEVVVLGYPTGMRALLARAEADFVDATLGSGPVGFWELALHLASGGYITPLATIGSIGQSTPGAIVYDAETTHGGSGGPVLTLDGRVVAVNAAILPEFGGSNLGVPIARVLELLADGDLPPR